MLNANWVESLERRVLLFAGQLDVSFGDLGTAVAPPLDAAIHAQATAVARLADGKVLVAGSDAGFNGPAPLLARYWSDGRLDTSFGVAGRVDLEQVRSYYGGVPTTGLVRNVLVQDSGRILLVTATDRGNLLLALNPDGTPDTGFGTSGTVGIFSNDDVIRTSALSGLLLGDQSILIAGTQTTHDTSSYPGVVISSQAIYLHVLRDGAIDPAFGEQFRTIDTGAASQASIEKLIARPGGGAIGVGHVGDDALLVEIDGHGDLIRRFGNGGWEAGNLGGAETARGVAALADGSIVIADEAGGDILLGRYSNRGKLLQTFGTGGVVRLHLGAKASVSELLVGVDGRLLVVGNLVKGTDAPGEAMVAAFLQRGRFDRGYGDGGVARLGFEVGDAMVLGSSLLLAGEAAGPADLPMATRVALGELDVKGELDSSFGQGGTATLEFFRNADFNGAAVARQADGKIVMLSAYQQAESVAVIMRLDETGRPDRTFGTGGVLQVDLGANEPYAKAGDLQVDSQGRIFGLVTASFSFSPTQFIQATEVIRVLPDGRLDTSFASGGLLDTGLGTAAIGLQGDRLIVAGGRGKQLLVNRYDDSGKLDASFGDGGTGSVALHDYGQSNAHARGLIIGADGELVVLGSVSYGPFNGIFGTQEQVAAIGKFSADGLADVGFGDGGALTSAISPADAGYFDETHTGAFAADGSFVAAGEYSQGLYVPPQITLIRFGSDGAIDRTLGVNGRLQVTFPGSDYADVGAVAIVEDGKILIAGESELRDDLNTNSAPAVMRLSRSGVLDTTFGDQGVALFATTNSIAPDGAVIEADGSVIIASTYGYYGNVSLAVTRFLGEQSPAIAARIEADVLKIDGTQAGDRILLRRHADGLEVVSLPGHFAFSSFSSIEIRGLGGNDIIDASAANVPVFADGGDGDDLLLGGRAADLLLGGIGNDTLFGGGGNDTLHGNDGNDYLNGGPGADQVFGDGGNDQVFAVDGAIDTIDGGDGFDRVKRDAGDLLSAAEATLA